VDWFRCLKITFTFLVSLVINTEDTRRFADERNATQRCSNKEQTLVPKTCKIKKSGSRQTILFLVLTGFIPDSFPLSILFHIPRLQTPSTIVCSQAID